MCLVKTPKIKDDGSTQKPLPILRNPFLDGLAGSIQSIRLGRSSLRIDRITDAASGPPVSAGGSGGSSSGGGLSSGFSSGGAISRSSGSRRDVGSKVNLV